MLISWFVVMSIHTEPEEVTSMWLLLYNFSRDEVKSLSYVRFPFTLKKVNNFLVCIVAVLSVT